MKGFYVYIMKRPDGTPFYVGKGSGDRYKMHEKEADRNVHADKTSNPGRTNVIREIKKSGQKVDILIEPCFYEEDAISIEQDFIRTFREAGFALTNRTGAGAGRRHSEKTKRKIAASNRGLKRSKQTRLNLSIAKIGKTNGQLGIKRSEKTKRKLREAWKYKDRKLIVKKQKAAWKIRKQKGIMIGENHPNAKMTIENIKIIRVSKLTADVLAERYNVSPTLVRQIKTRLAWKHVK